MAASNFTTSKPAQLIQGAGNFNDGVGRELDFDNDNGLVGVVSIMGVQSSGKSALMNECFHTDFKVMNQRTGMSQTTKGIWMSKVSFPDRAHKVLLLDCEGSDGVERGQEGNETFEKKVTLFALASSEVVMLNMKCDSVNLNSGSGMPLIRNVFQVMVRKFNTPRRVTLLFVLRDKNEVPLVKLREKLTNQLTATWDNVCENLTPRPAALEEYFKVEVVELSHYKYPPGEFAAEVVDLREFVFETVENGKLNPAANFINLTKRNWIDIQADKILNLKLNQNSVDEEFFKKIRDEIVEKFSRSKGWIQMKKDVRIDMAEHFGEKVGELIDSHLSEFDEETQSFNESSRQDSRTQVTQRLLELIEDTYLSYLGNKKASALKKFEQDVQQKIDASDSNFDTDAYTKAFFSSLIDAKIEQAEDWDQPYADFEEARSHISRYIDMARDIIKRNKEWEATKATQQANLAKKETDAGALGKLLGTLALAAATVYCPPVGAVLAAAKAHQSGAAVLPPTAYDYNGNAEQPQLYEKISSEGKF